MKNMRCIRKNIDITKEWLSNIKFLLAINLGQSMKCRVMLTFYLYLRCKIIRMNEVLRCSAMPKRRAR